MVRISIFLSIWNSIQNSTMNQENFLSTLSVLNSSEQRIRYPIFDFHIKRIVTDSSVLNEFASYSFSKYFEILSFWNFIGDHSIFSARLSVK